MIGFAELAALITVVGAGIYGLGLLGLAWPSHKRWNNDASTTWYAMSWIPRAVVAGQGMRIFMGFPTITAILMLMWCLIVSYTPPPFCSGIQPGCLGRRYLRAARAIDWWLLAFEQIPPAH
jgi:hypothetical protein